MFKHEFLTFEDLSTDETSGERYYVLPDGTKLPSVTTVLSRQKNDAIDKWKQRVGAEEAHRVMTLATKRGTAIHNICEKYLLNQDYKSGQMPFDLNTFNYLKQYLDQNIGTILGLEIPLYSKRLNTAGRSDCIAYYKDKLSIVDFKTARKSKKEDWIGNYFIQATCYALMAEEMFGLDIPQIVVMIAVDHEYPQIFRKSKHHYIDRVNEIFV